MPRSSPLSSYIIRRVAERWVSFLRNLRLHYRVDVVCRVMMLLCSNYKVAKLEWGIEISSSSEDLRPTTMMMIGVSSRSCYEVISAVIQSHNEIALMFLQFNESTFRSRHLTDEHWSLHLNWCSLKTCKISNFHVSNSIIESKERAMKIKFSPIILIDCLRNGKLSFNVIFISRLCSCFSFCILEKFPDLIRFEFRLLKALRQQAEMTFYHRS